MATPGLVGGCAGLVGGGGLPPGLSDDGLPTVVRDGNLPLARDQVWLGFRLVLVWTTADEPLVSGFGQQGIGRDRAHRAGRVAEGA